VLQLLRIERPPLAAANAPSIRQCRWTAFTEPAQPLVGGAEADSRSGSKGLERHAVIEVPTNQALSTDQCQSRIGVAMHGG